jgi:hypothetical protein
MKTRCPRVRENLELPPKVAPRKKRDRKEVSVSFLSVVTYDQVIYLIV